MKRCKLSMSLVALALLGASGGALADLTLKGRSSISAAGTPAIGLETLTVSGAKLRRDYVDRGKAHTFIYNPEAKLVTVIDHSFRRADIYGMTALSQITRAQVSEQAIKLDVKPTGKKHKLDKWSCAEKTLYASMPGTLGAENVTLILEGTVWLADDVPEMREVRAFVKASRSPEFFIGVPAFANASPAQAAALNELIQRLAPEGLPCAIAVDVKYEGGGAMANLARRMATRLMMEIESYDTTPAKPDAFDLPPGYTSLRLR
jgi:hypothetical protein